MAGTELIKLQSILANCNTVRQLQGTIFFYSNRVLLMEMDEDFHVAIKKYVVLQCDAKQKLHCSVNTCDKKLYDT